MKLTGSVVFLPVRNLAETRRFYTQVLGLELAMAQPGGAELYDTGRGYWGFCQYGDGRPALGGDKGVCLSLNCEDRAEVDARWQAALARGAQPVQPPARHSRFRCTPASSPTRTATGWSCRSSRWRSNPGPWPDGPGRGHAPKNALCRGIVSACGANRPTPWSRLPGVALCKPTPYPLP